VNCYILGCEQTRQAAVIDPGDEINTIVSKIKQNNLSLKYILLTHGHVDHVAQLARLKETIPAEVLMHADDRFLFETISMQAMMFGLPDPGNPKPDRFVNDGEKVKMGELEIGVLHTPGHSPGSVTYKVEDNLFVGDLIFSGSIGRTDLPGGNYETLINSVQTKIFTLQDETKIHPGHGPMTTVGQEKRFNPFFS
jgi:glyoxylase-like metal-dependent hydrolase (beta-lactamase superfamily II)